MKYIFTLFVVIFSWAISGAVGADMERTGYVSLITTEYVELDGKRYPLKNGSSNDMRSNSYQATECWANGRTTCRSLAGVGYIDRARVLLRDGVAVKIEVIELKQ